MRLTIADLSVERGGRMVLDGFGLTLGAGEALAVTGPNGAGKSTLLRAIAGLVPFSGRIEVEGAEAANEALHFVGHLDGVKTAMTAAENAAFYADLLGGDRRAVPAALDALGIGHAADLPALYLSAGQRRRLALTRLAVAQRMIWLLDEPGNALDTDGLDRLASLVEIHRASGGMVIAATHAELGWPKLKRLVLGRAV